MAEIQESGNKKKGGKNKQKKMTVRVDTTENIRSANPSEQ